MSPDLRAQLQSTLGSAYTLERELGGGGMSRVFVADEVSLGRKVVVKVVAPELVEGVSVERFTREVKLAARLQQANIVPVLASGTTDGLPYYTMPFVDGLSLRSRLRQGQLPLGEAMGILRDVARALAYAHGQGVVHRDIKPENILLSGGAAVVTDFGIAKALSDARTQEGLDDAWTNTGLTRAGTSLGTPAYMSPEQALGDSATDHRADLYSWGVMAWELLAGKHPFSAHTTQSALVGAHIRETPPPLSAARPDIPGPLSALVMQCLEKEPANRPTSAAQLLEAIDATSTPSAGLSSPPRLAPRGRRGGLIIVGAFALVAIALAVWLRQDADQSAAPVTVPAPGDRSIAVLPLANLSGDKADDYFGIGLAEEMTRALSKTGVRVIGRTSAGALQARGLDERAIAQELGVGSLLTGSVQRDAGQVRINVSLISAKDGAVTWNERYDRPLTNVFALQDEIARAVAAELLGSFGGAVSAPSKVETSDPEAYALYLQGQVLFGRRTRQTVQQAIDLFERAVERDPRFARAHAALALAITAVPYYEPGTETGKTIAPRVYAAAQKAIAIDSTVAEAWGAIAAAQMNTYENRKADANFRRAQALDSATAILWGWHGLNLSHMNRMPEAHERMARAQAAEPASLIARTWGAQILMTDRQYTRADSATRAILAMDSTYALAWDLRGETLSYLGRHDEAVAALERNLAQLAPDRMHETEGILAFVYARAGRPADARRVMETLRRKNRGELPSMAVLAAALEQLGDHDAAIRQLERAVRQPDAWLQMYNRSERYESLRRDPRGRAALESIETW
jgi:TolB-like protein/tetratricopeptide (TPR) repeat protein/tRNA A-37 threonylcarbamoyl transferase component Bud32